MTDPRVIRFFVDVQNKTRLETNLQAAGVLPSLNAFEARAMRVVASSLREEARVASPPQEQQFEPNFLAELIYNSVTTLLVGEKIMIEMPTLEGPWKAMQSKDPNPYQQQRLADQQWVFRAHQDHIHVAR